MFLQEVRNYNHIWEKRKCNKLHTTVWNAQCKSIFWVYLCKIRANGCGSPYYSRKQLVSALYKDTTFKPLKIISKQLLKDIRYVFIFLLVTTLLFSNTQYNNVIGRYFDLRWKEVSIWVLFKCYNEDDLENLYYLAN